MKYQLTKRTVARLLEACDGEGHRYARRVVRSLDIPGADPDDIYQVAADKLWIKPPSLVALYLRHPKKIVGDLFLIKLKKRIKDEASLYKRSKGRAVVDICAELTAIADAKGASAAEVAHDVKIAMDALTPRERAVFVTRTVNGLSWGEAAAIGFTAHDRAVIFPRALGKVRDVLRHYA